MNHSILGDRLGCLTADRLAQLVERRTTVREVLGFEPQTGPTLRVLK